MAENTTKTGMKRPGGRGARGMAPVEKAKDFIYRNARPLDLAKW